MTEGNNPFDAPDPGESMRYDLVEGEFAPCPRCGGLLARRVGFTLWGAMIGPYLLHHVRCQGCGYRYNGRTGRSNTPGIVILLIIAAVVAGLAALIGVEIVGSL